MAQKRRRVRKRRPTHREEAALLQGGYSLVAGLDEVGRGPLAGPVVAGAVMLPAEPRGRWVQQIRDSKQLTAIQRQKALAVLGVRALSMATGMASHREIDRLGIVQATRLAMERAIHALPLQPQFLLLDAFPLPDVSIPQKAIVHGDALCLSIAAASIVAKVERDRMMVEQDALYPGYGFASHKGYASSYHLEALQTRGPSPIHRRSFAPLRFAADG